MSRTEINDGGHAFPPGIAVDHAGDSYHGPYGMSLRDWFAGSYSGTAEGISATWAERIMGSKAPDWALDDGADCVVWWIEAEARLRYLHADAMLAARKGDAP